MSASTAERTASPVISDQSGIHPRLATLLARHREAPFRKPPACHTASAIQAIRARLDLHGGPLILDNGCGTGESTIALADRSPASLVIGIDKSAVRLERAQRRQRPSNAAFVRANLVDVWHAAAQENWPLARQYLLYPNPWPKQRHLMRRWHAHPAFAELLRLGTPIELRSNWPVYIAEFELALRVWGGYSTAVEDWRPQHPMSAFERKYLARGHSLLRLIATPSLNPENPSGRGL